MSRLPPGSTRTDPRFPYSTLIRSDDAGAAPVLGTHTGKLQIGRDGDPGSVAVRLEREQDVGIGGAAAAAFPPRSLDTRPAGRLVHLLDRTSTRLNPSH